VAWAQRAEQTGAPLPASLVAGAPLIDSDGRPVLIIDDDATIVVTHSEKGQAAATFKHSFGYHPVLAFCDNTNEALAGMLRPGNAGSNTAADHIELIDQALAQIPDEQRHGYPILIRADGAGSSKAFLAHIRSLRDTSMHSEFSIGWAVTAREHTAIAALPKRAWTDAIDIDGDPRESAAIAELTGVLPPDALVDYPPGTRIIIRRERPHPGAQLDLIEHRDGWRYTCFATDTRTGQHAFLDARHRSHARVEDRIRCGKDTGLGRFPSRQFAINQAANMRAQRDRPDRLDPNHPAPRRPGTRASRTKDLALPAAARRRPTRARRTQTPAQDRPDLALGTNPRTRVPSPAHTAHTRDLNLSPRPCDPPRTTREPRPGRWPARHTQEDQFTHEDQLEDRPE